MANNPISLNDPSGLSWLSDLWDGANEWARDLMVAVVAVAIIWASGGSAIPALQAIASAAGGAAVTSAIQAAFQGGDFWKNFENKFHYNFRISALFLAGSSVFAWGDIKAGGDGLQGWITDKGGKGGGLTFGSGTYFGAAPSSPMSNGWMSGLVELGEHEFGRYIQYTGLMAVGSAFGLSNENSAGAYYAVGLWDGVVSYYAPTPTAWYDFASWLGAR